MRTGEQAAEAGGVMPPAEATASVRDGTMVRVWDPFVRVFHWSLVGLFVLAFVTGDELRRAARRRRLRHWALVAARIVWGFIGPRHARFSDFVRPPRKPSATCEGPFGAPRRAMSVTIPLAAS